MKQNIIIKSTLKTLRILPRRHKKISIGVLFSMIFSSLLDLFGIASIFPLLLLLVKPGVIFENPYLYAIYQFLGLESEKEFIIAMAIISFSLLFLKNVIYFINLRFQARFAMGVLRHLTSRLMDIYFAKGYFFLTENNTNHLAKKIAMYPRVFSLGLVLPLLKIMSEFLILLVIITLLVIFYSKLIFGFLLFVIPLFYLFYRLTRKKLSVIDKETADYTYRTQHSLFDVLNADLDIRISGNYSFFKKRFTNNISQESNLRIWSILFSEAPVKIIELGIMTAIITLFLIISFSNYPVDQIVETLGVFGLAAFRCVPSMNRIATGIIKLKSNEFTFDSLDEIELSNKEAKIAQSEDLVFNKNIKFDNISFAYPGTRNLILDRFSFTINKGQSVGIIGQSGSGKTTLMNIFLGFLRQSEGDLLLDGIVLDERNKKAWHKKVGYVKQEVFLLDDTLLNNIAFGDTSPDINLVNDLVEKVQLKSFVDSSEKGIHINVGEKGAKISGGQRQRIGIARALYKNPEILVFDEATSALDENTEDEILDLIKSLSVSNITTLIISHRKRTFKYTDEIIDFDKINKQKT